MRASTIFGGVPVGALVAGQFAGDASYLACDGTDYLKSAYPQLDTTNMTTFGTNVITSRTLPVSQTWSSVAFGNGVFVAVSSTSGTSAASSSDGITWTTRTIPTGVYTSVIYAAGLFVAVGTNVCATSPDGITWTTRTFGTLTGSVVAYGNGLFVAFSNGTASTTYLTSPDAITWTSRTVPASFGWGGVRWDSAIQRFIAIANLDSGLTVYQGAVFISADGINWSNSAMSLGSAVDQTGFQPFGDKWYCTAGVHVMSSETNFAISGFTNGWAYNIPKGRAAAINGLYKAGEWLFVNDGGVLYRTRDGSRWDVERLPSTVTVPLSAAYGNNTLVLIPRTVSASTVAFSWAVDSTKFRVPVMRAANESDRMYIKAK